MVMANMAHLPRWQDVAPPGAASTPPPGAGLSGLVQVRLLRPEVQLQWEALPGCPLMMQ